MTTVGQRLSYLLVSSLDGSIKFQSVDSNILINMFCKFPLCNYFATLAHFKIERITVKSSIDDG